MHNIILDPKQYFYCEDGKVLKNLVDLEQELDCYAKGERLSVFFSHVTSLKNDFSNWVRDVFLLPDLATDLRNSTTSKEMFEKIKAWLDKGEETDNKETSKETNREIKKEIKKELGEKKNNPDHDKKESEKNVVNKEDSEDIIDRKISDYDHEEQTRMKSKVESFSLKSEEELDKVKSIKKRIYLRKNDFGKETEELEEEYSQLYSEISNARKSGIDVFIPAIKISNIKSKIAYLKSSGKEAEIKKIKKLLSEIRLELEDAKKYRAPDIRREVMEALEKESEKTKN